MEDGFQIGDRVVVIRDRDFAKVGMAGEIVAIDDDGQLGVCFDESFGGGHGLDGCCPVGHGHWLRAEEIQLIDHPVSVDTAALDALLLGV